MRILVPTSTFPRWDNDTEPSFVYDLCKYLLNNGVMVDVLAPHTAGAKRAEIMGGINVYRYKYFFENLQSLAYNGGIMAGLRKNAANYLLIPFFLFFQLIAIQKRLRNQKYDAIHAHWIIPQGLVSVLAKKLSRYKAIPLICTSHGGDLHVLNNPVMKALKKWIIKRCDHLCVVSEMMKRISMEYGFESSKISVISMGVDLRKNFIPLPDVQRYGNRIIFVGRLVEKKGVSYLIDSIDLIKDKIPEVELLIVGDGPLRQSLESHVQDLSLSKNIVFKGGVRHELLPALYNSASIAVLPSVVDSYGDQEGLGLTVVEAMGSGCAVVASSLDAVMDVIKDGGSGFLCEPGNPGHLAEKLQLLLMNAELREEIAQNGREYVLERYDCSVVGEKYLTLLESFC